MKRLEFINAMDNEQTNQTITNQMLLTRLIALEIKMDTMHDNVTQILGAWAFIRILGSVAVGIAIMWTAFKGWLGK